MLQRTVFQTDLPVSIFAIIQTANRDIFCKILIEVYFLPSAYHNTPKTKNTQTTTPVPSHHQVVILLSVKNKSASFVRCAQMQDSADPRLQHIVLKDLYARIYAVQVLQLPVDSTHLRVIHETRSCLFPVGHL
jgi:hypothetical protein